MAADPFLIVGLLSVMALCLITLTAIVLATTGHLHQTLRKMNGLLPHCDQAFQEARHTLHDARGILSRADRAMQSLEKTVQKTSQTTWEVVDQLSHWKQRALSFLSDRFGNGVKHERRKRRISK